MSHGDVRFSPLWEEGSDEGDVRVMFVDSTIQDVVVKKSQGHGRGWHDHGGMGVQEQAVRWR